jgi:hypothetical protein
MDQPRLAHGCGEVREPIPMENAGAKESACEKNEPPISSTASLVGGPCFSRGELDCSPAEKAIHSERTGFSPGFRGQR